MLGMPAFGHSAPLLSSFLSFLFALQRGRRGYVFCPAHRLRCTRKGLMSEEGT